MKVNAMAVKNISHEPLTDEERLAGRDRHEQIVAMLQSTAYILFTEKLAEAAERATKECLRMAESGDSARAAFQAGKAEALRFAFELPQRLLSES